jgi:hypothetical protein
MIRKRCLGALAIATGACVAAPLLFVGSAAQAQEAGASFEAMPPAPAGDRSLEENQRRLKAAETDHIKRPKRRTLNPGLARRASQPAAEDAPLLIEGILRQSDGQPAPQARIRIDLEPSGAEAMAAPTDEAVDLVNLGQDKTDGNGRFKFKVKNLGDLSGYTNEDGSASLLITSFGDSASLLYHLRLVPDSSGKRRWMWDTYDNAVAAGPNAVALKSLASVNEEGGAPTDPSDKRSLREKHRAEPLVVDLTSQAPGSNAGGGDVSTQGVNGSNYCSNGYQWRRDDQNEGIDTHNRLQRVYTKSGITKWEYNWSTTTKTQQDVSANVGYNGSQVAAGYVGVQSSSTGINFIRPANHQQDARAVMRNKPWRLYCSMTSYPYSYSANVHEWRPAYYTGYNNFGALNTPIFNCDYRYEGQISNPTWVAKETTLQFSVGTNLAGVNLRTATSNDESHKLTLTPTGSPWVCGYLAPIAFASQVREK